MLFRIESAVGPTDDQGVETSQLVKVAALSIGRAFFCSTCAHYIMSEEMAATVNMTIVSLITVWSAWMTLPMGVSVFVTAEIVAGLVITSSYNQASNCPDQTRNRGWKVMKVSMEIHV